LPRGNRAGATTLELRTTARAEYELEGVGTIRTLRYWEGAACAGGVTWTLRRPHGKRAPHRFGRIRTSSLTSLG